jgi:hypothetical protein
LAAVSRMPGRYFAKNVTTVVPMAAAASPVGMITMRRSGVRVTIVAVPRLLGVWRMAWLSRMGVAPEAGRIVKALAGHLSLRAFLYAPIGRKAMGRNVSMSACGCVRMARGVCACGLGRFVVVRCVW